MPTLNTIKGASRYFLVKPDISGVPGFPYLELGPGGTSSSVSMLMVQFNPTLGFDGSFVVLARPMGPAAADASIPFEPVPYRVGSLNNVAQIGTDGRGWPWSKDTITGTAIIQIPTNGLSVVLLLTAPSVGTCGIASWDLQGSSAV